MLAVDKVYTSVAQLIGACYNNIASSEYNARNEIALTESATVAWTRVFYSMLETKERELISQQRNQQEMIILVSEAEYAANCVAAVKFARDHTQLSGVKWRVVGIPSSVITKGTTRISTGIVDLDSMVCIADVCWEDCAYHIFEPVVHPFAKYLWYAVDAAYHWACFEVLFVDFECAI